MNDSLIAYGISSMKTHGTPDSGDAAIMGIGAMTAERWSSLYQTTSGQGLYPKGLDIAKSYTLKFVDQRIGMDMKH
jgi:NitT/TauT family transport system substrate-binding protein